MSSFVERLINVKFTLANGTFSDTGTNTLTVSGLRVSAMCNSVGGVQLGACILKIWGMTRSSMNSLLMVGKFVGSNQGNQISVLAGDSKSGLTEIFQGNIVLCPINFDSAPEIALEVTAKAGYTQQIAPSAPNSYKGSADVADIIKSIAKQAGFGFQNHGVSVQLSNPYFWGSAVTQIKSAAQAAGIGYEIHAGNCNIWPNGGSRDDVVIDISPATGMRGYPKIGGAGIEVRTLFNPQVLRGRKAIVTSDLEQACGEWIVAGIQHDLSSMMPTGPWFSDVILIRQAVYESQYG